MTGRGNAGTQVAMAVDRNDAVPLYQQILDRLRLAVIQGRFPPGARLPSTRILAVEWGVSRNTVLHVFETLSGEGYLEGRTGDGTYVASELPARVATPAPDAGTGGGDAYPFRSLSRRGRELIDQSLGGLTERPQPFMPDVPDLRAFPIRTWLRLMNEVSGRLTGEILVHVSNAGYRPLREAIAHHVRVARGVDCTADQVIITTGSQQSFDLVARLLLERGDPVWIEEPGYVGARATLLANGCGIMPVPVDDEGMDLEFAQANFPAPRMIYVSPSRQYPLGMTLSPRRRAALLAFSRQSGAWVLEDDYDCDFRYAGAALPALQGSDAGGRVIHIGTFSKALLPSFRLGFVITPLDLADDFARGRAVIDRHASVLEQMVLAEFMHRGLYAAHLRRMRSLYRERQLEMIAGLDRVLGYRPPAWEAATGMHFVLPLLTGTDDHQIARSLWQASTVARPLSIYFAGRQKRPGLLLGYAAYETAEIRNLAPQLGGLRDLVPRG